MAIRIPRATETGLGQRLPEVVGQPVKQTLPDYVPPPLVESPNFDKILLAGQTPVADAISKGVMDVSKTGMEIALNDKAFEERKAAIQKVKEEKTLEKKAISDGNVFLLQQQNSLRQETDNFFKDTTLAPEQQITKFNELKAKTKDDYKNNIPSRLHSQFNLELETNLANSETYFATTLKKQTEDGTKANTSKMLASFETQNISGQISLNETIDKSFAVISQNPYLTKVERETAIKTTVSRNYAINILQREEAKDYDGLITNLTKQDEKGNYIHYALMDPTERLNALKKARNEKEAWDNTEGQSEAINFAIDTFRSKPDALLTTLMDNVRDKFKNDPKKLQVAETEIKAMHTEKEAVQKNIIEMAENKVRGILAKTQIAGKIPKISDVSKEDWTLLNRVNPKAVDQITDEIRKEQERQTDRSEKKTLEQKIFQKTNWGNYVSNPDLLKTANLDSELNKGNLDTEGYKDLQKRQSDIKSGRYDPARLMAEQDVLARFEKDATNGLFGTPKTVSSNLELMKHKEAFMVWSVNNPDKNPIEYYEKIIQPKQLNHIQELLDWIPFVNPTTIPTPEERKKRREDIKKQTTTAQKTKEAQIETLAGTAKIPQGYTLIPNKTTKNGKPLYKTPDGKYWTP